MKKLLLAVLTIGLLLFIIACTRNVKESSTESSEVVSKETSSSTSSSSEPEIVKTDILPLNLDDINYINFCANVPESYNSQIADDIAKYMGIVNDFEIIEDYEYGASVDVMAVYSVELKTGEKFALRLLRDSKLKSESGYEYHILHISKFPENATRNNMRSDIEKEVNFTAYKIARETYGDFIDVVEKCSYNAYINFGGNPPENIETPLKINLQTSEIESANVFVSQSEPVYKIKDNKIIAELINKINDCELSQAIGQPVGYYGWSGFDISLIVAGEKKYIIIITSQSCEEYPYALHFTEIAEDTAMTEQEKEDYDNLNYVNEYYNYALTDEQFSELSDYIKQALT